VKKYVCFDWILSHIAYIYILYPVLTNLLIRFVPTDSTWVGKKTEDTRIKILESDNHKSP